MVGLGSTGIKASSVHYNLSKIYGSIVGSSSCSVGIVMLCKIVI